MSNEREPIENWLLGLTPEKANIDESDLMYECGFAAGVQSVQPKETAYLPKMLMAAALSGVLCGWACYQLGIQSAARRTNPVVANNEPFIGSSTTDTTPQEDAQQPASSTTINAVDAKQFAAQPSRPIPSFFVRFLSGAAEQGSTQPFDSNAWTLTSFPVTERNYRQIGMMLTSSQPLTRSFSPPSSLQAPSAPEEATSNPLSSRPFSGGLRDYDEFLRQQL